MATPPGLYSSLPRDHRGNQIRMVELFRADALQAEDIFHFDKSVEIQSDGCLSLLPVNAKAVVRAPDKAAVKGGATTIRFDVLENGHRSALGAFTGPKLLAEALAIKTSGLRKMARIGGLSQAWEDFQVWRDGKCLGTAAEVRNCYYVKNKVGVPPRTRVGRKATLVDLSATAITALESDLQQNSHLVPPQPMAGLATAGSVTTAATDAPEFSGTPSNESLAPLEQHRQLTLPNLTHAPRRRPPQPSAAFRTVSEPARQSPKDAHAQLEDTVMRELFHVIPANHQPQQYTKTHTAIYAKRYINFLQRRAGQAFRMIRVMGVTEESLVKMVGQIDDGLDVAAVMRKALEWEDEEAPLGNPLGRYDPARQELDVDMENVE